MKKTLAETFADLPRKIEGIDEIEYLIINDGSSDKTVEVAKTRFSSYSFIQAKQRLGKGFMAGIDACLHLGADIIVNTDADNQYCGADIEKLVKPILDGKADIIIGERPINETAHFSWQKKKLQRIGSWVVRLASNTKIPDAPSGFRAYSREAALRLNVINDYTYTLETIIQAGHNKMAIMSVPVRTNPETRKSRLFKSMWGYIKRSALVIIRSFMMYKPLRFFGAMGSIIIAIGLIFAIRFFIGFFMGHGDIYVKSLIFSVLMILLGTQTIISGLQADIISANRKLLEDIQYRMRKLDYELLKDNKISLTADIADKEAAAAKDGLWRD